MREIKFRAWDNQNKKYITSLNEDSDCDGCIGFKFDTNGYYFKKDSSKEIRFIFEQFTGLHDKNGKEIYEGDVCSVDCGTYIEIDFIKYEGAGFKFHNENIPPESDIEVIGSIHENPELIK